MGIIIDVVISKKNLFLLIRRAIYIRVCFIIIYVSNLFFIRRAMIMFLAGGRQVSSISLPLASTYGAFFAARGRHYFQGGL